MSGFLQLVRKEVHRFMSISAQTVLGPLSSAFLYQIIFGHQLNNLSTGILNVTYAEFLIPGLVMMQVLLNAFANGSSSFIQSKYTGNLIYVLMAPITPFAIYCAYLIASMIRGIIVGIAVFLGICWFGSHSIENIFVLLYFLIIGASITGGMGVIAGILCDKFDQLGGFQSFIMVPLIYLAGVFFNPKNFTGIWAKLILFNPFMYIVDGFRYGFIQYSSYNIFFGAIFVLIFSVFINGVGYLLIKHGIKIKR